MLSELIKPALQLVGSIGAGFAGSSASKSPKMTKMPLYSQGTTNVLDNLVQQGGQNSNFGNIENQARRQFHTQTVPGLAERFTSMGQNGGQRSSAFSSGVLGAGADLESQLAGMRSQYGLQQLQTGLRPTFENNYQPARQSWLSGLLGGLSGGLGSMATAGFGQAMQGGGGGQGGGGYDLGKILNNLSPQEIPVLIQHLQSLQGGQ